MGNHIPVLLKESMEALAVKVGGRYVDGTFGRGGHSREIARRGGEVLGIDRDDAALESAARIGDSKVKVAKGNQTGSCWTWVCRVLSWMTPDVASAFSARDPLTCGWTGLAE